jgi:tetratricopeptide (TPR) repeat protein
MGYGDVGREPGRFWAEITFSKVVRMKLLTYSWKLGTLRGVEIRLHFSLLFSLIITYSLFHPTNFRGGLLAFCWLIGFVLSVFLHEVGHAWAARRVNVEVKSILLWLLGGLTFLEREPEKPFHRLFVYAAGPLATLVLSLLFAAVYLAYIFFYAFLPYETGLELLRFVEAFPTVFLSLAVLNIVLLVFNLLPVYPFDGGRIVHAFIESFFGKSNANLVTMLISTPILIGLIAFGIYVHDYVLLISSLFIALAIGTLNRRSLHWINLGLSYLIKRPGYYFLQGDYARAEPYYTRDIKREPQQVNHYIARALCYFFMLEREKACADVERALQIAPNNEVLLLLRADVYALEKNYEAALDLIAQVQALKPNWAHGHMDHGSVLMKTGSLQLALDEFNRAISLTSQIPLFYVERSIVYLKLGNLDLAHKDQDSALALSEKDALTRAEFALQAYEGCLDWAEDYYARALQKRPRSWYAYQGRADAYRINNEHEKAIADYTRALEINPKEPGLYLGRGKSYRAKGEIDCAVADFRQVSLVTNKIHLRRQAENLSASLAGN